MPRVAITYEQVAAVANDLYARGVKDPGAQTIRDELAKRAAGGVTGSPNTIQRHLVVWRSRDRPLEPAEIPQLPPQLASDIARALNAAASVAREKVEEHLAKVQSELDDLVTTGEAAEARIEELTQELAARTSERDSMAGQLRERTDEVVELKKLLAAAAERTAILERELHVAQTEAQEANGRVDEIRTSTQRQLELLRTERAEAHASQVLAEKRAIEAEKEALVAKAHLDGERAAKMVSESQVAELQATVKRMEPEAARAAGSAAEAAGLRSQVQLQADTIATLRGLLTPDSKPDAGAGAAKAQAKPK